jgi:hypothetical protein
MPATNIQISIFENNLIIYVGKTLKLNLSIFKPNNRDLDTLSIF